MVAKQLEVSEQTLHRWRLQYGVTMLVERLRLSERRACQITGQLRSTQRHQARNGWVELTRLR